MICTTRSTPGSAPPRSPAPSVSTRLEVCCLVRLRRPQASGDERGRVQSGREMTPRSHAFCRPSPRTPCGGVASYEARTVRLVAPASVEGRSPGNCFSGQHGPSIAELRARGPGYALGAPGDPRAPLLVTMLEHPLSPTPGESSVWRPGPAVPVSAKAACVSGSPRRDPTAVQPGCLGRFVST